MDVGQQEGGGLIGVCTVTLSLQLAHKTIIANIEIIKGGAHALTRVNIVHQDEIIVAEDESLLSGHLQHLPIANQSDGVHLDCAP